MRQRLGNTSRTTVKRNITGTCYMRTIAKGLILSLLALGSAAGTAVAADLPTRKAPPEPYIAPQPMTWTGFYIGVNGGFAGDAFRYPFELGVAGPGGVTGSAKINSSGFLGGVQAGFNWQFAPTWVAGVEGDLD